MSISLDQLTNPEKVFLINALRSRYKLKELLPVLQLSKSSYCYQVQRIKREDKYKELRDKIKVLFADNNVTDVSIAYYEEVVLLSLKKWSVE